MHQEVNIEMYLPNPKLLLPLLCRACFCVFLFVVVVILAILELLLLLGFSLSSLLLFVLPVHTSNIINSAWSILGISGLKRQQ